MGNLFRCFEARIDDGDGDHPDTMLDAWRQHGDFREEALICRTGHYLMRVPFRTTVGADDYDSWAEEFDKVPTGPGDGEDIGVRADVAEDFEGGMVLEQEVHFNANSADVLEHIGELHVLGIRSKSVKSKYSGQ